MPEILFVLKKQINTYGISIGLLNSAQLVVNCLKKHFDCKAEFAIDGNCIDRIVSENNPKIVFIEALWVTPAKIKELLALHKDKLFIIRTHSKVPFLSEEGMAMDWLYEYSLLTKEFGNLIHSPNSKEISEDLEKIYDVKNEFLPNIYIPKEDSIKVEKLSEKDGRFHVGCFGAIRPFKNQLIQAQSAINFAIDNNLKLDFHINTGRVEQRGSNALKNIRGLFRAVKEHRLIEHNWLNHNDFIQLCKSMDMGLQVSFTESFNIVSADFVWNHIPVVVSAEIDWVEKECYASPNSTKSISDTMLKIYNFEKLEGRSFIVYLNKRNLEKYNKHSEEKWCKFIRKHL